jgi:uncharacterized membrane protein
MMTILALVLLLAIVGWRLSVPLFEFVFAILLCVPLLWLLSAKLLVLCGLSLPASGMVSKALYVVCFGALLGAARAVFGVRRESRPLSELYPFGAFAILFAGAFYLCTLWPDFMAMGERLRDYAILASVVQSPIVLNEPWMDGAVLNYYVYWYRFGAMLSALLGLQVWETYHVLVAFAISFYGAVIFQIVRVVIGGSALWSLVSSIVLSFGSNYAGLRLWKRAELGGFEPDDGWWGPSRVIQGAINEFPAWSFLLGDAHPHYLNLGALPFFFLLLGHILNSSLSVVAKSFQACALIGAGTLFLLGSNAWEVPMWVGLSAVVAFVYSLLRRGADLQSGLQFLRKSPPFELLRAVVSVLVLVGGCAAVLSSGDSVPVVTRIALALIALGFAVVSFPYRKGVVARLRTPRSGDLSKLVIAVFWVLLFLALYLSSRHIVAEGGHLTLVRTPIPVTTTAELFVHWGFHLTIIVVASLLLLGAASLLELSLAGALLMLGGLYDKGALIVVVLIGIQLLRLSRSRFEESTTSTWREACADALLLAGLGLVLMPEIFFLDDPYGGENERMNTIFKIYETAWGLLALGAIGLLHRARRAYGEVDRNLWLVAGLGFSIVLLVSSMRFLLHTVPMRRMEPSMAYGLEGLAAPDNAHHGAGAAIRTLRSLPRGRVLEAQGNAYSYTSFVGTLAAQPSYLGWANHVNLLTRQYDEVGRREKKSDQIYLETECSRRQEMVRQEEISYIVIGTLERIKYPDIDTRDFSCFTRIMQEGDYILYSSTRDS